MIKLWTILIFLTLFSFVFAGEMDSSYSKKELISLGNLNQYSIWLSILRDGLDDILSYPTIEWKMKNSNDTTRVLKKEISEIWGVLNIFDIGKKNYKDSVVVEMTLTRIGTKAYGKMVIHKDKTYEIEIVESIP